MHDPQAIDPADLRVHPEAAKIPEWPKDDPEFLALVDDIQLDGIREPLVCVKPNLIVHGRARWRAARQLQLTSVPVRWDDSADVATLVLSSLLHRRHFTQGARAYLAVPLLAHAIKECVPKRLKNLQKGQQIPDSALSALRAENLADLATAHGISARLFDQAIEVRKLFENGIKYRWEESEQELSLKEYFEPKILAAWEEKPLGLGAVIAGCGAKISPNVLNQREQKQLVLFTQGVGTLLNRFVYWQKFDDAGRKQAMKGIRGLVREQFDDGKMEYDTARQLANWFSTVAREIRREASATKPKKEVKAA